MHISQLTSDRHPADENFFTDSSIDFKMNHASVAAAFIEDVANHVSMSVLCASNPKELGFGINGREALTCYNLNHAHWQNKGRVFCSVPVEVPELFSVVSSRRLMNPLEASKVAVSFTDAATPDINFASLVGIRHMARIGRYTVRCVDGSNDPVYMSICFHRAGRVKVSDQTTLTRMAS